MDVRAFEDRITGSAVRLRELYRTTFSETEAERFVRETKKQNRSITLILLTMIALASVVHFSEVFGQRDKGLDLVRPDVGRAPRQIEADVTAEYGGYSASRRAAIRVLPREPSPAEAEQWLSALGHRLPALILGKNASLDAVNQNLFLPETDAETGAEMSWSSSNPRIISNDGSVNLIGAEAGTIVTLTVFMQIVSVQNTIHITVRTGAGTPTSSVESALNDRVDEVVMAASNERTGEVALLPEVTADGVILTWENPVRGNGFAAVFACIVIAMLCFSQRYRAASDRIEKARAEMERDFPDFIQKLGLLLGAGLVITSAISRIAEDYLKTREDCGHRRLYEELAAAEERTRTTGTPFSYEFSELARRSGLREMMRFSSMLSDNIDKGSALEGKLRIESVLLWESRKKRAEKEGRLAETKLIFPMALQIFAVIAITVMPAAFEMG